MKVKLEIIRRLGVGVHESKARNHSTSWDRDQIILRGGRGQIMPRVEAGVKLCRKSRQGSMKVSRDVKIPLQRLDFLHFSTHAIFLENMTSLIHKLLICYLQ